MLSPFDKTTTNDLERKNGSETSQSECQTPFPLGAKFAHNMSNYVYKLIVGR